MTAATSDRPENDRQAQLLRTPITVAGSGLARYGAAMHFYQRGMLTAEMLEIYRRCCIFDGEDPVDLARFEGITDELDF